MRVTRRIEELQGKGVDIVGFGAGEPDFPSPSAAVEAAREALSDGFTRYTPAAGWADLRNAVLEKYQSAWKCPWRTMEEVVITVGAKAALFELSLALLGPGDEVIIPSPCWVTFPEQVRLAGGVPVLVPGQASDGFTIHVERIVDAFTPATRVVLLNSPCNPTGAVLDRSGLESLVVACAERDILLISDETYERFVYDEAGFTSAAAFADRFPQTVVVVGSFSKTYAMTGWRVGYLLGPAELTGAVAAIQSHATSNPTSFAMKGAAAALELAENEVVTMIEEFRRRRSLMVEGLNAIPGVHCVEPRGAFYAFPDVSSYFQEGEGSVALTEYLLDEAGVAVVPGIAFGNDDHVRLSFTSPASVLEEGLARMKRALLQRPRTLSAHPRVLAQRVTGV